MVTGTEKKSRTKRIAPRSTGRPPKEETQRIRDKILDVAAVFFFTEGYGATSIEAIARHARISKRTIYHRFEDKPALFRAVVHRVIERLRPPGAEHLLEGQSIEKILPGIARAILNASLSPEALALHRIVLAEATRFPELALIMNDRAPARKPCGVSPNFSGGKTAKQKMRHSPPSSFFIWWSQRRSAARLDLASR